MSAATGGGPPDASRQASDDSEKQAGNVPDELRTPGENLAEFVQQLEDYMPTVSSCKFSVSWWGLCDWIQRTSFSSRCAALDTRCCDSVLPKSRWIWSLGRKSVRCLSNLPPLVLTVCVLLI